jgi:hypothetical protein
MHLKQARAECQGCSQTWIAPNAMGLASQHHERTGHPVEVHVTYKSDAPVRANARKIAVDTPAAR